ncbi:MAG: hypothetical protein ACREPR_13075 [Brasilonema sp.]
MRDQSRMQNTPTQDRISQLKIFTVGWVERSETNPYSDVGFRSSNGTAITTTGDKGKPTRRSRKPKAQVLESHGFLRE